MKKLIYLSMLVLIILSCRNETRNTKTATVTKVSSIVGTWKLVYAETREKDSIEVRDITTSDFIKIINSTHFAFLSQDKKDASRSYGGGGTYTIDSDNYVEKLEYTSLDAYRNKSFPFKVEIKGDSLIQYGEEEIKEQNIKKYIIEKYTKLN